MEILPTFLIAADSLEQFDALAAEAREALQASIGASSTLDLTEGTTLGTACLTGYSQEDFKATLALKILKANKAGTGTDSAATNTLAHAYLQKYLVSDTNG